MSCLNNEHIPLLSSPHIQQGHSLSNTSSISSTSSLTDTALIADEAPPTPTHHSHSGCLPPITAIHFGDQMPTAGQAAQPLPRSIFPNLLTMSSTVTLSAAATAQSPTVVANASGPLSEEVRDFMVSIGKDTVGNHDMVQEIYDYIGRALWESSIMWCLPLNQGTAKALVSLMVAV
jgi:hypothetical protein